MKNLLLLLGLAVGLTFGLAMMSTGHPLLGVFGLMAAAVCLDQLLRAVDRRRGS